MRVEPISLSGYIGGYLPQFRSPRLNFISPSSSNPSVVSSLIDSVSLVKTSKTTTDGISKVFDMLLAVYDTVIAQLTAQEEKIYDPEYLSMFLNYPNKKMIALANSIVDRVHDSNDQKALKITKWVHENLPYVTDQENYGIDEFWAPALLSIVKGSGDCEDGAFLVHSLMLHAGVPNERLRTYGGTVRSGVGAASDGETAGHGWTAYRRERDNQWVVLDTSYYINDLPVSERKLMKEDRRYIDDYFYFNEFYYVVTDKVNRVRDPDGVANSYTAYNQYGYGLYGQSKINIHLNTVV